MLNKLKIDKKAEFVGHHNPIYKIIAAPQPGRFFSGGGDKMIVEWDIHDPSMGSLIATFKYTIYSLCLVAEHQILFAGTAEGGIHVIDLSNNKEIKYFQFPGEGIFDIQYQIDQSLIVASTSKGNLVFIDIKQLKIISTLSVAEDKIRGIAFHTHLPYLYVACSDNKVYVIDLAKQVVLHHYEAHQWACNAISYQPETDQLITGSKDAHIRIWDIKKDYALIKNIPAHNYAIYQVAYNPTLEIYATASRDKTIKLWDKDMQILIRINKEDFDGHINSVNTLCWLNDHSLISAGDDRKIMLWEVH
jgi:WD repeat-containing protein 61